MSSYLVIGKNKKVETEIKEVPLSKLKFYQENPRLISILEREKGALTEKKIEELFWEKHSEPTRKLKEVIETDGAINEPLIVYKNKVLEGNTRLCILKELDRKAKTSSEKTKWSNVPCQVIKEKISQPDIDYLLGRVHIIQKKDWEPYELAVWFKRRKREGASFKELVEVSRYPEKQIQDYIKTFDFMVKNKISNPKEFTKYYEINKSTDYLKAKKKDKKLDKKLIKKITEDNLETRDVRDLTRVVLKDKKAQKKYFEGKWTLGKAKEVVFNNKPEMSDVFIREAQNFLDKIEAISRQRIDEIKNNKRKKKIITKLMKEMKTLAKKLSIKF